MLLVKISCEPRGQKSYHKESTNKCTRSNASYWENNNDFRTTWRPVERAMPPCSTKLTKSEHLLAKTSGTKLGPGQQDTWNTLGRVTSAVIKCHPNILNFPTHFRKKPEQTPMAGVLCLITGVDRCFFLDTPFADSLGKTILDHLGGHLR